MLLWQMLHMPWIWKTYRTQMLYTTCGSQRRSKKEKNQSNPETPKKKSPLASVWCFKFVHSFLWIAFCIVLRVVLLLALNDFRYLFKVQSMLFLHTYNRLYDCSFTRHASVDHTCLRLGSCCLREHLFKINSGVSPICKCSFDSELVKHFFLYCPGYAA